MIAFNCSYRNQNVKDALEFSRSSDFGFARFRGDSRASDFGFARFRGDSRASDFGFARFQTSRKRSNPAGFLSGKS
jgi:hypothetical protein